MPLFRKRVVPSAGWRKSSDFKISRTILDGIAIVESKKKIFDIPLLIWYTSFQKGGDRI
jgi:hypothetical protein